MTISAHDTLTVPQGANTAWAFSTAEVADEERAQTWRAAIERLRIPLGTLSDSDPLEGKVYCRVSPLGMEFALVEGSAMEFSGKDTSQPDAIWFSVNISGDAELIDGERRCDVVPGDMVYGPAGRNATLRFPGPFRQFFIRAPKIALNPRVLVPMELSLGHLSGSSGIHSVFSGMLRALADVISQVEDHHLRPIELAISEFLLTSLEAEKVAFGLGGNIGAKAAHFRRVCQDIEANLSDPDLSLKMVADMSGASTRYIQKLFAGAGEGFSNYIRTRRLDRCRQDMASPLHADLSISEICFRWGFNGTAHFSRSFKTQYGITPRDYRRAMGGNPKPD